MQSLLSDINIQQLINFITVVDQNGFQAASEYLHMTQSAVSKSIGRLEDTLGFPLFLKSHKGNRVFREAALTEQGKYLYDSWAPALNEIENAYQSLLRKEEMDKRTIRIAYTTTSDPDKYLWPILEHMKSENGGLRFQVESRYRTDLLQMLSDGIYHVIFLPDVEYYSINQVTMDFCYAAVDNAQVIVPDSSPLYAYDSLTVDDIKDEEFFVFDDGKSSSPRQVLQKFFQDTGIMPHVRLMHQDAYNVSNTYHVEKALMLVDNYFSLSDEKHLKRIPLAGYYAGPLCVWKKDNHKQKYIRQFLQYIPDLEEKKRGKLPVIPID